MSPVSRWHEQIRDLTGAAEPPVASVHLGYETPDPTGTWLQQLGDAAAETIMRQIENEGSSPRLRVERTPASYAALGGSNPGFSAGENA